MSDQFIGEIRVGGWNFAPTGFAQCNGQLLPISQNTALFSILGTMYGGDGKTNFALPDLQGQAPVGVGQGPGLSQYFEGESLGSQTVTVQTSEMPAHSHQPTAAPDPAEVQAPAGDRSFARSEPFVYQSNTQQSLVFMSGQTEGVAGGSQPHNNMPPVLTLMFVIALQGIFPPRS